MEVALESLSIQLDEILALESIYDDSFIMNKEDQENRKCLQQYVDEGALSDVWLPLHFSILISAVDSDPLLSLIISFILPKEYPSKKVPIIDITCPTQEISRGNIHSLESRFHNYINEVLENNYQECIFQALEWIQEELNQWKQEEIEEEKEKEVAVAFERVWMYFHHIYSSKKRRYIVDVAKQMKLTGFCLSGKPGIICIEGENAACESYVRCLRALAWKRMTVRHRETTSSKWIQFGAFREIQMESSAFRLFLTENGFAHIFELLFQL